MFYIFHDDETWHCLPYQRTKEDPPKNHVWHSISSTDISIFQHTLGILTFIEFLNIILIKVVAILMWEKLATPGLLKINVF